MAKLKAVIPNLDEVPEALHELYTEKDGKFILDAEGILTEDDVKGLKKSKETILGEKKALEDKLAALKDIDPEEYKALKAAKDSEEERKAKTAGTFDEIKAKWEKQKAEDLAAKDTIITTLQAENRKIKLEDKVRAAALKGGVTKELVDDVLTVTSSRFEIGEKDQIVVKDGDGDPMDINIDTFFGTVFKEQRPQYYAASGAGGSGAPAGGGRGPNGKARTISASDQQALNSSIEDIAAGKAVVAPS